MRIVYVAGFFGPVLDRLVSGVNYFFLSATIRIPHQRQLHLVSSCLWLWCFSQPAPASSLCLLGFACSLAAPGAKPCDARRAERLGRSAGRGQRAATFHGPAISHLILYSLASIECFPLPLPVDIFRRPGRTGRSGFLPLIPQYLQF